MASYELIFKPSVHKDLRSLPKSLVARVLQRIEQLQDDPFPRQASRLSGTEQLYRIRVGEYRIVYGVDKETRQVTIHHVRHRREVYRAL
jgi:mRNA interferase RelE/StbE